MAKFVCTCQNECHELSMILNFFTKRLANFEDTTMGRSYRVLTTLKNHWIRWERYIGRCSIVIQVWWAQKLCWQTAPSTLPVFHVKVTKRLRLREVRPVGVGRRPRPDDALGTSRELTTVWTIVFQPSLARHPLSRGCLHCLDVARTTNCWDNITAQSSPLFHAHLVNATIPSD